MTTTNQKPVERIYPNDTRVKPQTIAHHLARYDFASRVSDEARGFALDLGCGSGYGSDILRKVGYTVQGIDRSKKAIEFAKRHFPEVTFIKGDLLTYDITGVYELITMFEVIEHLPFQAGIDLLYKISNAMPKNGVFLMSTPRDTNDKYNTFHKSEWPYTHIKNILGSIFSEVRIWGQDWDTAEITFDDVRENDFYIAVCKK